MFNLPFVLATCLLLWAGAVAQADNETQTEIARILDAVERTGAKGQPSHATAYLRLGKLKPATAADPRVKYAYLLGLIHCNKSKEASEYASNLIESDPDFLPARLIRVRFVLKEKKFDVAFADLEAIGQRLAADQDSGELSIVAESSYRLLGLAFGYLEGPGKTLVKDSLGAGIKQRLLKGLSPERLKVFDEAYQMVQAEHHELITNGEKAFEELRAKNQAIAQEADSRRAQLAERQQKAESQAEQERAKLRADWEAAYSQYMKVGEAFIATRTELASLNYQRALAAGQLATLAQPLPDKNGRVDPQSLRYYNQRRIGIQNTIANYDQQTVRSQVALQTAWQQGAALEAQLTQLMREGNRLGEQFALQKQDFSREERKIKDAPKLKKSPAIKKRDQLFATYDDFNWPLEKQRLLDSCRAAM